MPRPRESPSSASSYSGSADRPGMRSPPRRAPGPRYRVHRTGTRGPGGTRPACRRRGTGRACDTRGADRGRRSGTGRSPSNSAARARAAEAEARRSAASEYGSPMSAASIIGNSPGAAGGFWEPGRLSMIDPVRLPCHSEAGCRFPPHGSPDLRHPEEPRHPEGAPLLRRAAGQDPLRRPAGAGGLARRAPAVRPEVRGGGAGRPRLAPVRRPRPRRRAPERGALARQAGRGAAAAPDAAGPARQQQLTVGDAEDTWREWTGR